MTERIAGILKQPKLLVPVILLLLLSLPVGFRLWQIYSIPNIGEPFDVDAYLKSIDVPPEQNAFVMYRAAGLKLVPMRSLGLTEQSAREAAENASETIEKGWKLANNEVRDWLDRNRPALQVWQEGTERPLALEVHPARLTFGSPLSGSQNVRQLARLALLQSAKDSAEGRPQRAWQWQLAVYRSVRHLRMNGTILAQLVGNAIYMMASMRTLDWAADETVEADDLRQALEDLEGLHADLPPPSVALKNEYLIVRRYSAGLPGVSPAARLVFGATGESSIFQKVTALVWANWLSQIDRPPYERPPKAPGRLDLYRIDPETADSEKLYQADQIERWANRGLVSPTLLQMLTPAIGQFDEAETRRQARQAIVITALALHLWHRRHGTFPESLDALTGSILEEVPADPYGRGEPIRYRRDPSSPHRAILWTIGFDRQDDQAQKRSEWGQKQGDWVVELVGPNRAN